MDRSTGSSVKFVLGEVGSEDGLVSGVPGDSDRVICHDILDACSSNMLLPLLDLGLWRETTHKLISPAPAAVGAGYDGIRVGV